MLAKLAALHQYFGTAKFILYNNLRPPKNQDELWAKKLMQKQITEVEYKAFLKKPACLHFGHHLMGPICLENRLGEALRKRPTQ